MLSLNAILLNKRNVCGLDPKKENKTPEIKEEDIQKGAPQEFCGNETELLSSKTVSRIINVVDKKNWEAELVKPASFVCANIYDRFISNNPISKNERDYLVSFFKKDTTKKAAQEIVSKLNIQHGPGNIDFIRSFLENEKGENVIVNPLRCILYKLENYPFVLDFDFDEITLIPTKTEGQIYYHYKKDDKYGIVLFAENKIHHLEANFDYLIPITNGLIFGSIKGEKVGGNFDPDYMIELPPKHKHTGFFYQFNGTCFEEIYKEEGIKKIKSLKGFLIPESDNGQEGVLKVFEVKKDEDEKEKKNNDNGNKGFKVEKVLDTKFNQIKIENDFIFGFVNSGNVDLGALEIYKNTQIDFTKSPFQIKDSIPKLLEIEYKPGKGPNIEFFNKGENLSLLTKDGQNIYIVDNDLNRLVPIEGLQGLEDFYNLDYISKILNEKIPICLRYDDGKRAVRVIKDFGIIGSKFVELIKLEDNISFISDFDKKTGMLKIGEFNKLTKYICFLNKNSGNLYILKKGCKYKKGYLKKGLFGKKIGIFSINSFDDVKDYFDQVDSDKLPISL